VKVPADWPLLAIAVVAGGVAVASGRQLEFAVPAGLVAVAAAGLMFAASMGRVRWRRPAPPRTAPPTATSTLRASFRSGRAGRVSIVLLLDRIERTGPHPELPARTAAEDARFERMPRAEFRAYVAHRLDEIEAANR
jgi:hypothetical protein